MAAAAAASVRINSFSGPNPLGIFSSLKETAENLDSGHSARISQTQSERRSSSASLLTWNNLYITCRRLQAGCGANNLHIFAMKQPRTLRVGECLLCSFRPRLALATTFTRLFTSTRLLEGPEPKPKKVSLSCATCV